MAKISDHEDVTAADIKEIIEGSRHKTTMLFTWQDALRVELVTFIGADGIPTSYFRVVYKLETIIRDCSSLHNAVQIYNTLACRYTRTIFEHLTNDERVHAFNYPNG